MRWGWFSGEHYLGERIYEMMWEVCHWHLVGGKNALEETDFSVSLLGCAARDGMIELSCESL